MSLEKLVTTLGEQADRKTFLRRAGTATLATTFGFLGFAPDTAYATWDYLCCHLCNAPSSCTNCRSVWCWNCCVPTACETGDRIHCCECYSTTNNNGSCTNAICSYITIDHTCPKCVRPAG
jgi:hypothetical protein